MLTAVDAGTRFTSVVAHPASPVGERHRAARAAGFAARPGLDLEFFGGKTMPKLTFTNVYLGGPGSWSADDVSRIDHALAAAMTDPRLNNVVAQYYPHGCSTTFEPSRTLTNQLGTRVYRDTVEGLVASLDRANGLSGFDLASTVFCFLLPKGVVLVDGDSTGSVRRHEESDGDEHPGNLAASEHDEADDSLNGLGGYHGSVHARHGTARHTVYYAVAVYSEGRNGIVAFDRPWKNVCATLYHELCEARTDPDVEDAIRAGNSPKANDFLGWYSPKGGEIGDIPMEEAGARLDEVMKEVPLADGSGTVPIQLMWSNAVGGPEGPIATPHAAAARRSAHA